MVALVTPFDAWLKLAGSQALLVWQDEHCAVVLRWPAFAGVQPLPL